MGGQKKIFGECAELVRCSVNPNEVVRMPYIGLEHIKKGSLTLNSYGWSDEISSNKASFSKGDILFGKLRPYFRKVIRAPFDGICSTDIWVVKAKEGIDQGYLYYWMSANDFVNFATQGSEGTKMPRAKWGHVSRFERLVPPLPTQRRIAHILGSLDDKIELNRRMNRTLEAIARAIFKSWFVDFDPVCAKMDGRTTVLPAHIAALFPDSFQDSKLEKIPKGWRVGALKESFNVTMGQSPPGSTYNEDSEGLPFYQGRRDFDFRYPSLRVYCNAPKRLANKGDTLVSVRAPVGDINMAIEQCCIGRGVSAVRHKKGNQSYTYYSIMELQHHFARFEQEGTVFGSINKEDFNNLKTILPSNEIIKLFDINVSPFDELIENNHLESTSLTKIRDSLLPQLMRGELIV